MVCIASSGTVEMPVALAKSFPEPEGIRPSVTLSGSYRPFKTSLSVPSPPITIIVCSAPSEVIL